MSELDTKSFDEISSVKFELKDGCILRKGAWDEETLAEWQAKFDEDSKSIESVINHVHIQNLFWLAEDEQLDVEDMKDAGNKLRDAWAATLSSDFPDSTFEVILEDSVLEDGWVGDMSVTAFQVLNHA